MAFLGILLLLALMIPIVGHRASTPRSARPSPAGSRARNRCRRAWPTWRGEVEVAARRGRRSAAHPCKSLQEENQFLQRLLEDIPAARLCRRRPSPDPAAGIPTPAPRAGPLLLRGSHARVLVAAGIFLSRIFGLVRQRVLAHYLGLSDARDAFTAAFRIPESAAEPAG